MNGSSVKKVDTRTVREKIAGGVRVVKIERIRESEIPSDAVALSSSTFRACCRDAGIDPDEQRGGPRRGKDGRS
jgi:hypothetical protein